jgi:hypothetical protein
MEQQYSNFWRLFSPVYGRRAAILTCRIGGHFIDILRMLDRINDQNLASDHVSPALVSGTLDARFAFFAAFFLGTDFTLPVMEVYVLTANPHNSVRTVG